MACRVLEIFWGRGRHFRAIRWLPVLAVTVILTNLATFTASQVCPNGTYYNDSSPSPHPTHSPETGFTTSSMVQTTIAPVCLNCNDSIAHCALCSFQNNTLSCSGCESGYTWATNDDRCKTPPSDKTGKWIAIGVVFGSLIVIAVVVGIVFGVRRGVLQQCQCCAGRSDSPPPMPDPDGLGASFTSKKGDNQSGTGQRVDLRYTGDPGGTSRRDVESVHYDGINGQRHDEPKYVNAPRLNIPCAVKEDCEVIYTNTDDDQTDQVYTNAEVSTSVNQSSRGKLKQRKTTPVQESSKQAPPQTKPKPTTSAKPVSPIKTNLEKKGSLFPPAESDEIYSNDAESDDDEDYVNRESYQPTTNP